MKKGIVLVFCGVLFTMLQGCSYSLYQQSKQLSTAKMLERVSQADVDKIEGYTCTIMNKRSHSVWQSSSGYEASRLVITPLTAGIRDGFDGYLMPGQKMFIKLLPGKYLAEAYNSRNEKYDASIIKEVLADGHVYDGSQYVTQTFEIFQ